MKIEPRTMKVLRKYLLKKHTPVIDFERGSVWVPSRAQDGVEFIAHFAAPDLRSGVQGDMLAVCPDIIQSEINFERIDGGVFLKGKNGAHFRIAKTRLCCVGERESNRAWTLTMRAKKLPALPQPTWVKPSHIRAAESIAARFKKCHDTEQVWRYNWLQCDDGKLLFTLYNDGFSYLRIWLG